MYGAEDPSIAAMVLDSPFSDLVDLMMELVDTYKFRLPKFTVSKSKICCVCFLWGLPFVLAITMFPHSLYYMSLSSFKFFFQIKFAIQYMRRAVQKKAKFDITELNTIKVVSSGSYPYCLVDYLDDELIYSLACISRTVFGVLLTLFGII